MESQVEKKSPKKLLLAIAALLLLAGAGFAAYWFLLRQPLPPSITLANGKLYPEFSENTTSYTIYTQETSLSFSCSGDGTIAGCDAPVAIVTGSSTHQITIGQHHYSFSITRLDPSDTTLKIKSVRGNPTAWSTQAELVVAVENSGSVKELEYSFDGGKTWRTTNIGTITKNGTYKILARDYFGFLSDTKSIKVTKVDSEKPIVNIVKEQTDSADPTKSQAILTAVITEELSGVKSIAWNTGATTESITVHTGGTYTVTVTDKAGNATKKSITVTFKDSQEKSSEIPDTSGGQGGSKQDDKQGGTTPSPTPSPSPAPAPTPTPEPTPAPVTQTFVAQFVGNGATASTSSANCATTGTSCTIHTATISRAGWEIIGWSTNQNATTMEYPAGTDIRISGNLRLYAITKKTISGSFVLRDAAAATLSASSASCTLYNTASSCNITSPTLTALAGYTVVGWNTSETSTADSSDSGATISISADTTFYSVTYLTAPLTAEFVISDPAAATQSGGLTTCTLYNGADFCSLQAPTLAAKSDDYVVDGWYDPEHDTTLDSGATFTVTTATSGRTYYAITRSTNLYSATFNLQDSTHLAKSTETTSCTPTDGSCTITVPTLSVTDDAFEAFGWSTDASATAADSLDATLTLTAETNGVSYYSVSRQKSPLTATFTIKDPSALSASGSLTPSCYLYNGATSCDVVVPSLTVADGYTFDGWSRTDGATTRDFSAGDSVALSQSATFYSVSRRNTPLSATFNIVNASVARFSDGSTAAKTVSCYLTNGATSCTVTSPALSTDSGYTALGWAESSTASAADFAAGTQVALSANKNYYSVVVNAFTVTFVSSDPSHLTFAGDVTTATQTCNLVSASSCTVNFPAVTTSDGREFLGWTSTKDSTTVDHLASDHPSVSSAITYYTVSKKDLTLSFSLVDAAHFSLASPTASCTFYNSASGCSITAPTATPTATGYSIIGWATTPGSTTISWNGSARTFSASASFHSVTRYSTPFRINYIVAATDAQKVSTPPAYDECYLMNGAESCAITLATLTPTSASYSFAGWGTTATSYDQYFPGGINLTDAPGNYNLYAIVGSVSPITFVNGASATGSNVSVLNDNNLSAQAISFTSGSCVNYDGANCYIKKMPYLYSPGNDIFGFGRTQLGGISSLLNYTGSQSVTSGTQLYSRIWNTISAQYYHHAKTFLISFTHSGSQSGWSGTSAPAANAEYYAVEFEQGIDSDVSQAYADFILDMANHIPVISQLHGKTRFMTNTSFDPIFNPDYDPSTSSGLTLGVTHGLGQFAPVAVRLAANSEGKVTSVSELSKYSFVHELGHATEFLVLDHLGGKWPMVFEDLRVQCYNLRTSGTPCLSDYAFYNVQYDTAQEKFVPTSGHTEDDADVDGFEFFAELFAAWYNEQYTNIDIATVFKNYGTKHDSDFEHAADEAITDLLEVISHDYNLAATNME